MVDFINRMDFLKLEKEYDHKNKSHKKYEKMHTVVSILYMLLFSAYTLPMLYYLFIIREYNKLYVVSWLLIFLGICMITHNINVVEFLTKMLAKIVRVDPVTYFDISEIKDRYNIEKGLYLLENKEEFEIVEQSVNFELDSFFKIVGEVIFDIKYKLKGSEEILSHKADVVVGGCDLEYNDKYNCPTLDVTNMILYLPTSYMPVENNEECVAVAQ